MTDLLSNYPNRAGPSKTLVSASTSAVPRGCAQLQHSAAGRCVHNHMFVITSADNEVMLAKAPPIFARSNFTSQSSVMRLYIWRYLHIESKTVQCIANCLLQGLKMLNDIFM